jgi:hypothetical protein
LCIAIELKVRRLDAPGDSQLVIDQVMKNSHCRDPKMEAYCDEVQRLEGKFYGLELNHIARRYNETADELAKIASGRTTVPPDVFSRDLHQPSVKTDDTPEPEKVSALPEAPSAQPEAPSAPEGEALRVEEEQNGVPEREMCPSTISKYFGDLVSKQVLKCKMVDKVQTKNKGMFLRLSTLFCGLMDCV